jgi:hypothetical protein
MFKSERKENKMNSYREPIRSKYLTSTKKKYNLASVDHNINQLMDEQHHSLTDLLIALKSEYDELIRDTGLKTRETEELMKQIEMLEKVDKKIKSKADQLEENYANIESLIKMKKVKKNEEVYNRTTYINLIEKLKEENQIISKEIANEEIQTKYLSKNYQKEKIEENLIKERINQTYLKINENKQKNSFEKSENALVLNYYKTVIHQKWAFINSADERKGKQIKIAIEAKNDTQDKQEVEKRRILFMYTLYDKFLKKKMHKELIENAKLEETFQVMRDITVRLFY